jgi:hypothetical protein
MTTDLVKKAKDLRKPYKSSNSRDYSEEELKLALAWVHGEVGMTDVLRTMDMSVKNRASGYNFLSLALKKIILENGLQNNKPQREL